MKRLVLPLVAAGFWVVLACSDGLAPGFDSERATVEDMIASRLDSLPVPRARPGDDPLVGIFEELPPPGALSGQLQVGQCVVHYQNGPFGYTPIPYDIPGVSEETNSDPSVQVVMKRWRGRTKEAIAARAVCLIPASRQEGEGALEKVRDRVRLPGLTRAEDGSIRQFEPDEIEALRGERFGGAASGPIPWNGTRMIDGVFASLRTALMSLGPTRLHAAEGDDPPWPPWEGCEWEQLSEEIWRLTCEDENEEWDDYEAEEGECPEEIGYYSVVLEECVCWNGLSWLTVCVEEGGGGPPPPPPSNPSIEIECSDTQLTRGSPLDCTAQVYNGAPPGQFDWRYSPSGFSPIEESESSGEWYGTVVVSGTVRVEATVQGDLVSDEVNITIAAREWSCGTRQPP